uniref:Uncharacterized protein n=1 Tax=Arundo donax TaxID=35708 RepID=A0A0A9H5N8_ARUDO
MENLLGDGEQEGGAEAAVGQRSDAETKPSPDPGARCPDPRSTTTSATPPTRRLVQRGGPVERRGGWSGTGRAEVRQGSRPCGGGAGRGTVRRASCRGEGGRRRQRRATGVGGFGLGCRPPDRERINWPILLHSRAAGS